jgi:ssDNA-binding Zn-finger/Zn-ribbon topoisomerase 1
MTSPACGECGSLMVLRLGRHSGTAASHFWSCSRFPDCTGAHGAHADGRPLGIPADKPTRQARILAHAAFDAYWRKVGMTRNAGYRWLAGELGLDADACHIGMFDQATCARVSELCLHASLAGVGRPCP